MTRIAPVPPRRRRKAPCYIFEGTWWGPRETPLVLPFLQALGSLDGGLDLSHRTFRSADDLKYWFRRIPKNDRALVYISCHATGGELEPADGRSKVTWDDLLDALRAVKPGAIEFLHFGACEIIERGNRRGSLQALSNASRARWVSGYVEDVDWLRSMLLDLAVVAELFLPFYHETSNRRPQLRARARWFLETYGQQARTLGFSGLARKQGGVDNLIPGRLTPPGRGRA
jgi:hypothetical protein